MNYHSTGLNINLNSRRVMGVYSSAILFNAQRSCLQQLAFFALFHILPIILHLFSSSHFPPLKKLSKYFTHSPIKPSKTVVLLISFQGLRKQGNNNFLLGGGGVCVFLTPPALPEASEARFNVWRT